MSRSGLAAIQRTSQERQREKHFSAQLDVGLAHVTRALPAQRLAPERRVHPATREHPLLQVRIEQLQAEAVEGRDVDADDRLIRLSSEHRRLLAALRTKAAKNKPA